MVSRRNEIRWGICTNTDIDGGGNPCPNCAKKIQLVIRGSQKFECPECKSPLTMVPAPKTWWEKNKWFIVAPVAVLAIGAAVLLAFTFSGSSDSEADRPQEEAVSKIEVDENDKQAPQEAIKDSLEQRTDTVVSDTLPTMPQKEETINEPEGDLNAKVKNEPEPKPVVVEKKKKPSDSTVTSQRNSGSKNLGYATFKGTLKNGVPDDVNGRLVFSSSHVIDSKDPKGRVAEPGDYVIGEFSEGHLVQGIWYGSDNVVKGSIIIGK